MGRDFRFAMVGMIFMVPVNPIEDSPTCLETKAVSPYAAMAQRNTKQLIEADLTWTGERFERGIQIEVEDDGFINAAGPLQRPPTRRLRNRAILPGMINAHSHAFQRGLRGLGETFPQGAGNFWTWREAMYKLVDSLDASTIREWSVQCFREMLAAGVTTVGEFHYVHHDSTLKGYALDEVVLEAAKEAGIRLVLINTYYKTGGIGRALAGGQLRFRTDSPGQFWDQFDTLQEKVDSKAQSLAAAAHSVRAASIDEISELHGESIRRGLPFHMHVEEQPQEVADCVHAYGKPPMALLNERLDINPMFTAVHCTHTAGADMEDFLASGGNVCINPLTEGNLGDGIPNLRRIIKGGGHVALGSDSNLRLCWTEEMRWLEYGQRLSTLERGVCVDGQGRASNRMLQCATTDGARSLGVKAGAIKPKHFADFFTLNLSAPSLTGWTADTLLDAFIFGCGNEVIAETCVAGQWNKMRQCSSQAD
jgi:formimidoylglutamate deiminase